jgi:hypothetical protein
MGVAASSNVAAAYASVSTTVSDSISVSDNQVSVATTDIVLDCYIGGNVSISDVKRNVAIAKQMSKLLSNTNLTNSIDQDMMQTATSTVGLLGVGYATASNAATAFSNTSNNLSSSISQAVSEVDISQTSFACGKDGRINGNVTLNFSADNSFLGQQDSTDTQVRTITNKVTQKITQKASATVQGIGILLLLIIMVIVVLVMVGGSAKPKPPAGGPAPPSEGAMSLGKIAGAGGATTMVLGGLCLWGYLAKAPPFFQDPNYVSPNASSTISKCEDPMIDIKQRTLFLEHPPLRYAYNLFDNGPNGAMLPIMIIRAAGTTAGNNGGMNAQTYINEDDGEGGWVRDKSYADAGFKNPLPNLLSRCKINDGKDFVAIPSVYVGNEVSDSSSCVPGAFTCGSDYNCDSDVLMDCNSRVLRLASAPDENDYGYELAVPNIQAWKDWITDKGELNGQTPFLRALHARFVLSRELGLPTDVYVDDNEEVTFKDPSDTLVYGSGKNYKGHAIKISHFEDEWDGISLITGGAQATADLAICNTRLYKVQNTFSTWALWVVIGVIVAAVLGFVAVNVAKLLSARKVLKGSASLPAAVEMTAPSKVKK